MCGSHAKAKHADNPRPLPGRLFLSSKKASELSNRINTLVLQDQTRSFKSEAFGQTKGIGYE
jgi:hypothetical protein